jgi:hypothetical protein
MRSGADCMVGFAFIFLDGGFVEIIGFALFDMNGVLWTVAEAGTQAVTQIVGHEFGFAVDDLNGTFRTGRHAKTASVAFFLIDMNDIPFHACSPAAEG